MFKNLNECNAGLRLNIGQKIKYHLLRSRHFSHMRTAQQMKNKNYINTFTHFYYILDFIRTTKLKYINSMIGGMYL